MEDDNRKLQQGTFDVLDSPSHPIVPTRVFLFLSTLNQIFSGFVVLGCGNGVIVHRVCGSVPVCVCSSLFTHPMYQSPS